MKHYLTLLIVATALSGCQDNSIDQIDGQLSDKRKQITIAAQTEPMDGDKTRGTPINSVTQMTNMGVFCSATSTSNWTPTTQVTKMFNTELVRNATTQLWDYATTPVNWDPSSSLDKYTFFAYAPFEDSVNGIKVQGSSISTTGAPVIIYTAPADVTLQPDLMFAIPRYNLSSSTSTVALKMKHALTCVGFQIQGNGEKIKAITITGVYAAGTALIKGDTIAWGFNNQPPAPIDYSPSLNYDTGQSYVTAGATMSTNLIKGNGYLMLVPQILDVNAKLILTLDNNSTREISLNNQAWIAGRKITYNIIITPLGILTITPSTYYIPASGTTHKTDNFDVSCNPVSMTWQLSTTSPWLKMTTNADGSAAASSIIKNGPATVYTVAIVNTLTSSRLAQIYAFGDPTREVARITQIKALNLALVSNGGNMPVSNYTYVGAFWRAAETGERIIRVHTGTGSNMTGRWSASVVWKDANWADDDIRFSIAPSLDTKISYTSDSNPDPAEGFKVTDNRSIASGTAVSSSNIYFRIGLMSPHNTALTPARYAVVELQYNNHSQSQIILLRQGEDADYIMRANDLLTGAITITLRPLARAFSPYNLTQKARSSWAGGPAYTDHESLAKNGGAFTNFPSQAGALFTWASTPHPRLAYHPINPTGAIISWDDTSPTAYWRSGPGGSTLADKHETCPIGYRRVNDGSEITTSILSVATSEVRQSMMKIPIAGNALNHSNIAAGCYADGFFDRRQIVSSPNGNAWSTVSFYSNVADPRNANVAYRGTVVYNPVTWASVFFPNSGMRNNTNGQLSNTGATGFYWTSSSLATTTHASTFNVSPSLQMIIGTENARNVPGSIRCIKIP